MRMCDVAVKLHIFYVGMKQSSAIFTTFKLAPVSTEQETGWAAGSVWTHCGEEKSLHLMEMKLRSSNCVSVTCSLNCVVLRES